MPFGIPTTPAEVVRQAANNAVGTALSRAIDAANAGDNIGAAQGFFQALAVSAAFTAGTLVGFAYYPVSGLSQALRNLGNTPGAYESALLKFLPVLVTCPQSPYQSKFQKSVACKIN